jgi:hypothetical protein
MAEPSLGQALGLTVERRDIFAPAAKQLAVNLASFAEKKERKQKAKEESASKFMSEMFKLSPDELNRKVRPDAVKFYNGKMTELETLLDNPEINQVELLKKIDETRAGLASFRDQSTSFDSVDKLILSDPNKVPTPLRNFMSNKELIPDLDTQTFFNAYGVDYDPESNMIRSVGSGKMDVREELIKNKASADALLQNIASDPNLARQNMFKIKTVTGYDPEAYLLLKPDQQSYLTNLSNIMSNNPSALPTISDEILNNVFNGNEKAYAEAVNKIIMDQYQKDSSQLATRVEQQAAFAPKGMGELTKFDGKAISKMTPQDAMKMMATEYMLKQNFPEYVQRTTSVKELNKTSTPKGGSGSGQTTTSPSATTVEAHLSSAGKLRAKNEGMDEQVALDISLNRRPASAEEKKKANRITQGAILGDGPTISFQTQGNEVVTIGRQSVNPRKLWYDRKRGQFHLIFDKQVSGEGTSENIFQEDMVLTREQLKQLNTSPNTSVKAQLEQWNLNSKSNNVPTIDSYIAGGSSASKSSSAKTTTSGAGIPIADLAKRGLNIKDYVIRDGKAYPKK